MVDESVNITGSAICLYIDNNILILVVVVVGCGIVWISSKPYNSE